MADNEVEFCAHALMQCRCQDLIDGVRVDEAKRWVRQIAQSSERVLEMRREVEARVLMVQADARRQIDTALDEAASFSAEIDRMVGELSSIRMEHEAEVAALRSVIAEGIEAFRLTKEYVNVPDENGFVLLPDVEGWSHFDWTEKARAVIKEADRG